MLDITLKASIMCLVSKKHTQKRGTLTKAKKGGDDLTQKVPDKPTLKELRIRANLIQAEAAPKIGVTVQTLRNWERYATFPDLMQLKKICEVYGCSLDSIFIPDTLAESENEDN